MPFLNEYAARQEDPKKYNGKFHRENNKFGKGINVIWGTLPNGKTEIQTIRFSTTEFKSTEQVKKWLEDHNFKTEIEEPKLDSLIKNSDGAYEFINTDSAQKLTIKKNEDGTYSGKAYITRTGVFNYQFIDKKSGELFNIRQLRHPDEVFNQASLDSLKMKPISIEHPKEDFITPNNFKNETVGFIGDTITKENNRFVVAPLTIIAKEGIDAIEKDNLRDLSAAYKSILIFDSGVYEGKEYDARQTNIRYNHTCITKKGRVGKEVALNVSDSENKLINYSVMLDNDDYTDDNTINNQINKGERPMMKYSLNGIEYEAAPEIINALKNSIEELSALKNKLTDAESKLTKVSADSDVYKAKVESFPEMVEKAVKEKVSLINEANKHLDSEEMKGIDALTTNEIKKKIILKYVPELKNTLDSENDLYVNASFNTAIKLNSSKDSIKNNNGFRQVSKDSQKTTVQEAKETYLNRLKNAYKKETK
jgi:hypothetical protein